MGSSQNSALYGCNAGQNRVVVTNSYEETFEFGMILGQSLKKGSVVALKGALGSGKTCLCAGICRALGVTAPVTSPTYTIIHEYEGIFPVYHIDAYRLSGEDDFENSGGGEILRAGGVSLIEWSERIAACLPPEAVRIEITILEDGGRRIIARGTAVNGCGIEHTCH
jgi:tRNA threonylcarbamoyladenosine biosynthesis protein TsaE